MKCPHCNVGDLHFHQEIFEWSIFKFWRFPEIVKYIFICDNCGKETIVNKN